MDYTVLKGAGGKRTLSFTCSACGDGLKTPLESAGQAVDCPTCGQGLIIPGVHELEVQRAAVLADHRRSARERGTAPGNAQPPRNPLNDQAADALAELASVAAVVPRPVQYAAPTTPAKQSTPRKTPTYLGLSIASGVLLAYAGVMYLAGLIAIAVGLYGSVSSSASSTAFGSLGSQVGIVASVVPGFVILFGAAMSHGLSTALIALRDIAINSFRG